MSAYNQGRIKHSRNAIYELRQHIDRKHGVDHTAGDTVKVLKDSGQSCISCTHHKRLPTHIICKLKDSKKVKHYNICQYHKEK